MSVIIAGVGVTAVMFYSIFRELFSGKSPNSVYSKALDRIMEDEKLILSVGSPIKAYGEESRRHRRGHVRYTFQMNLFLCMLMKLFTMRHVFDADCYWFI